LALEGDRWQLSNVYVSLLRQALHPVRYDRNQIYVEPALIGRLLGFFTAGFFFTGILRGPVESSAGRVSYPPSLIIQGKFHCVPGEQTPCCG
jgi:hypothetical protein